MRHHVWIKKLLLPPAGLLILSLAGLLLFAFGPAATRTPSLAVIGVCVGLLYVLALPRVGFALLRWVEQGEPECRATLPPPAEGGPGVIVVLDAGRYSRRPPTLDAIGAGALGAVKPETLERLAHAAALHHASGLPILVSGNGAGALMAEVLRQSFGAEVLWVEAESRNTQENATASAALLRAEAPPEDGGHVLLVTHAWHMPRAAQAFERTGLEVTPAPMGFGGPDRWDLRLLSWIPSVSALVASHLACHELLGRAWYALAYRSVGSTHSEP
ncbi:MAG: YdcF family protein [Holophagales bacterium]|nr:YdcF family protein [Holophagales bacterium]